ncbi:phosphate signaling complex protein PhoU [Lentibacillus sediminis]|uniref:phosphate signaling complex protein PhoU n=1 Tax=Lentibacillus sediminis TaxID=1940529 RepID=UPI000C1BDA92|nr:phosphate signaling complex protein PhoU [Lentibacillus sediminis]
MTTRDLFHNELQEVNKEIVELAELAGTALTNSIEALFKQNIDAAKQVIENDKLLDKKEMDLNDKTILLIAKQQPVATDLRRVIVALKIATDLERMGDNAKNIASATIRLGEENGARPVPENLQAMHDAALEMLQAAVTAFKNEDISLARKLSEMDDTVDKLYKRTVSELLGETATNPDKIQYVMQIAFCGRYLERFADHITNIGENILYLVKGENYNLN